MTRRTSSLAHASDTVRRVVLWVPDWPVVTALEEQGLSADTPAAVLQGRELMAVSASARRAGVRRGMRKRRASRACPDLVILSQDHHRDARRFEAVALAAEQVVAGVEIARPGLLMIPADGAARFHGSETLLAERLITIVAQKAGFECAIGAADGVLAAILAARASVLVPTGRSREFLAGAGIDTLALAAMEPDRRDQAESLVSVLQRLGLTRVGDLAALPDADVLTRFGAVGAWAQRLSRGQDVEPPVIRRQQQDIAVSHDFDPPAERVEQVAIAAAHLAHHLDDALLAAGMRCGRVRILAATESGQVLERVWRTDVGSRAGAFASHMAQRVRWQLEGWLSGTTGGPDPAPLARVEVTAEDVVALGDEQAYLWGGVSGADARAQRAVDRLQSLLGPDGVLAIAEQGGRSPRDRVLVTAWGQQPDQVRRLDHPWPGRLPDPPPATVLPVPEPLQVLDAGGSSVIVDRRLGITAAPTWVRRPLDLRDEQAVARWRHPSSGTAARSNQQRWAQPVPVESWAGPWPVVERWWSDQAARRIYMQIVLKEGGAALLASCQEGQWFLEGLYD